MIMQLITGIIDTFISMAPYMLIGLFLAGILHVFVNKDIVLKHLGRNNAMSVVKAAVFGIPLPLCSCGVLPLAMSLRKGKASDGATISFLISTPQTGADNIIATWGMLGPVFAVFRPIAALVMGITGGLITNLFAKKQVASASATEKKFECDICYETSPHSHTLLHKIKRIFTYAYVDFFDDISVHLAIGMVISGVIAFAIPDNFFGKYVGNEFLSMLIVVIVGIPLYSCVTASIPIAVALMLKGLSPGAAFVFLTVAPGTNVAFMTVIAKVMGKKILAVYIGVLAVLSMVMGYILNAIFAITGKQSLDAMLAKHFCTHTAAWEIALSWLFLAVIVLSFYRLYMPKIQRILGKIVRRKNGALNLTIEGMNCNNCARRISTAVNKIDSVTSVDCNVDKGLVSVSGTADTNAVKKAIEDAGFTVR